MHVIPGRHEAALWDCCRDPGPGRLVFPGGTALGESFATSSSGKPGRFSPRFAALGMIQLMSSLFMQLLCSFSTGTEGKKDRHPPSFPQRQEVSGWRRQCERTGAALPEKPEARLLAKRPKPTSRQKNPLSNSGGLEINLCSPVFGETCFSKRVCSREPEGHLLPPGSGSPTSAHKA